MDTLQERIHEYLPLNELEQLLKYLFQNHISYDQIDFDSRELLENVNPEKNFSKEETLQKFKQMIQSAACSSYLSTEIFIPKGRSLYIRRFPRYLKDTLHHHKDALEINIVLQGESIQRFGSQHIRLVEGDICIMAPNVLHSTVTDNDQSVMLSIIVYQEIMRDILQNKKIEENDILLFFTRILYGEMFYPYLICHTDFDTDLMGMAIDLEHTQDIPGPYTDRYMETGLELFLLRLLMFHKERIILGKLIRKQDSGTLNIMEYIKTNYKTVTLDSLAKTYNYSASYLSTLIKSRYGKTFKDILMELKLEHAVRLMRETDYSLTRIAELTGYSDKSYFFRCFKQVYHATPTEYLQQERK